MNNKKKTNCIIAAILLVALVVIVAVYPQLPDIIPTHWGMDGQIDDTGSKNMLFMLWAVIAGANFLMLFAEKIDPKGENYARFLKVFNIFRIVFTLFMCVVLMINILRAFNPDALNMNTVMYCMMGLLFAFLGNYLPKVKHNYTFGIKLPWTLASENIWNKTHRMAGPVWVGGGIIIMVCSFLPYKYSTALMLAVPAAMVIIPMIYSYIEFKKEKGE